MPPIEDEIRNPRLPGFPSGGSAEFYEWWGDESEWLMGIIASDPETFYDPSITFDNGYGEYCGSYTEEDPDGDYVFHGGHCYNP